nr:hypothetical protein [Nanoarchaeota archaeon]
MGDVCERHDAVYYNQSVPEIAIKITKTTSKDIAKAGLAFQKKSYWLNTNGGCLADTCAVE